MDLLSEFLKNILFFHVTYCNINISNPNYICRFLILAMNCLPALAYVLWMCLSLWCEVGGGSDAFEWTGTECGDISHVSGRCPRSHILSHVCFPPWIPALAFRLVAVNAFPLVSAYTCKALLFWLFVKVSE